MKNKRMYDDLCVMLEKELDTLSKKGDITSESLEYIDKLTHSLKSIATIVAMEEAKEYGGYDNYSRDNSYDGSYDSYNRYNRRSYDNMNSRSSYDNMSYDGRRGRDADNDGRYSEARYSRDASKDRIIQKLEMLKNDAMSNEDKMHIDKLIHQMNNN